MRGLMWVNLLVLTLLTLLSCRKIEVLNFNRPAIGSVIITNASPSHSTLQLSYSEVGGKYVAYCILENVNNPSACIWISGSLPSSYTFSTDDSTVSLSIFIKDKLGNISTLVQTNTVVSIPYLNSLIQYIKPDSSSSTLTSLQGTGNQFARAIDYDGTTFVSSAYVGNNMGSVYVYEEMAGVLTLTQVLDSDFSNSSLGNSLSVDGDTLAIGSTADHIGCSGVYTSIPETGCNSIISSAGGVYIYRKIAGVWTFESWIGSPYPDTDDDFGHAVAVSGDILAVAVRFDDGDGAGINPVNNNNLADSGVVYIYHRTGSTWSFEATIKAHEPSAGDNFGYALDLSGNTLLVGAHNEDSNTSGINPAANNLGSNCGAAYVFVRDVTGSWGQEAFLKASISANTNYFGISVAIDGEVAVVGSHGEDSIATDSGAAYVFRRSLGAWSQEAVLKASNAGLTDHFGYNLRLQGSRILVGARNEDSSTTGVNSIPNELLTDSGAAYVFEYSMGAWSETAYLKASNPDASDQFSVFSLAIHGDQLFVGSYQEDSNALSINGDEANNAAISAGAAYHFKYETGTWGQSNYVKARETNSTMSFGTTAADGNTLVVSAYREDGSSGAVYVYTKIAGFWVQEARLTASNPEANDLFGYSVAISGTTIVIGAQGEDSNATGVNGDESNNSLSGSGAVYVFEKILGAWVQTAYIKPNVAGSGDSFGFALSVSGDAIVVGAYLEDSNSTSINGDASNNSATDSGGAYVFRKTLGVWSQEAYLKAPNSGSEDYFGYRVDIYENMVAVGAYGEASPDIGSLGLNTHEKAGAVYLYKYDSGVWNFSSVIKPTVLDAGDQFGIQMDIEGGRIAVMANGEASGGSGVNADPLDNSATRSGAIYVFKNDGSDNYVQEAFLKPQHTHPHMGSGGSLIFNGNLIAHSTAMDYLLGEGVHPEVSFSNLLHKSGSVSVFRLDNDSWKPLVYLKAPNPGRSDRFGDSVAIIGNEVFVGARQEDGILDMFTDNHHQKGAVYRFDLSILLE